MQQAVVFTCQLDNWDGTLTSFPLFTDCSIFVIESRHGFNSTTVGTFVTDVFKSVGEKKSTMIMPVSACYYCDWERPMRQPNANTFMEL